MKQDRKMYKDIETCNKIDFSVCVFWFQESILQESSNILTFLYANRHPSYKYCHVKEV